MKMNRWGVVLWAVVSVVVCQSAHANPCDDPNLNPVQRGDCWEKQFRKSDTHMRTEYDRAIAAVERPWQNGTKLDFFRPPIEESQKRWKSWAEAQCRLEAMATMGSAEAYVGSMCLDRLTGDRAKFLGSLAKSLTPPSGQ
jgi:uncharacterized protein YecT (DUF1311 family)